MSTNIEWTDETWNPVTGCSKVSQGCKNCYAERLWPKVSAAEAKRTGNPARAFTDVQFHRDRIEAPLSWQRPRRIFVNSMSDLFHEAVTWETLDILFAVMALCQGRHTFQILTKRPRRMLDYFTRRPNSPAFGVRNRIARRFAELARNDDVSGFALPLPNVWLGVSVEDQETADERIPVLLQTPAAVRFISAEPLLGPIDLWSVKHGPGFYVNVLTQQDTPDVIKQPRIDQVIAGGESGPRARPSHPDWFRMLRDACARNDVAFFFKQWGEWLPGETEVLSEPPGRVVYPDNEEIELVDGRRYSTIEAHGREFIKVGKKTAGRQLDGRTHDDYPA